MLQNFNMSSHGPFDSLTALSHSASSSWPRGEVEGLTGGFSGFNDFLDSPIKSGNDDKRRYSKIL
jgi:hypothetical protein